MNPQRELESGEGRPSRLWSEAESSEFSMIISGDRSITEKAMARRRLVLVISEFNDCRDALSFCSGYSLRQDSCSKPSVGSTEEIF